MYIYSSASLRSINLSVIILMARYIVVLFLYQTKGPKEKKQKVMNENNYKKTVSDLFVTKSLIEFN